MNDRKRRSLPQLIGLYLRGIGMGAADVVPGVSGGTIAFITGIYEELIHSIKTVVTSVRNDLLKGDFHGFFSQINTAFLLTLAGGIVTSIVVFSRLILYLLEYFPVALWSFFFGLIVASAMVIYRRISTQTITVFLLALAGGLAAFWLTSTTPTNTSDSYWFIFVSGFIAICAMILPGISGSFILLLFGKYEFILGAVREFKAGVILVFILGCISGLAIFSNILDWMLRKYHDYTVAILAGFMFGSLNKVWPWKRTVTFFKDSKGQEKPLMEENIMPETYLNVTGNDPQLGLAVILGLTGFIMILLIEKYPGNSKAMTK